MIIKFIAICSAATLCGCLADAEEAIEQQDDAGTAELELSVTLPNAATPFFVPPHVGGDKEYKGHGPAVFMSASLFVSNGRELWVTVTMDATETKSDWTRASGSASYLLYSSNATMTNLQSPTRFEHHYIDTNHGFDTFNFAAGNMVKRAVYVGDTRGSEAGTKTGVQLYFHPITFTTL